MIDADACSNAGRSFGKQPSESRNSGLLAQRDYSRRTEHRNVSRTDRDGGIGVGNHK
jgi:hypothetical protein